MLTLTALSYFRSLNMSRSLLQWGVILEEGLEKHWVQNLQMSWLGSPALATFTPCDFRQDSLSLYLQVRVIPTSRDHCEEWMSWDTFHSICFCITDIEYYFITGDGQIIRTRPCPKPKVKNPRRTSESQLELKPRARKSDKCCLKGLPVSWSTSFLFFHCLKFLCMHVYICILYFSGS